MNKLVNTVLCVVWLMLTGMAAYAMDNFSDTTRSYAVPTLTKTPKGTIALSWTEKDKDGIVHFYWAESSDKGRTFGGKQLIASSTGMGSGRLMRPKLLFKKEGSMVAIFTMPGASPSAPQPQPVASQGYSPPSGSHLEHGGPDGLSSEKPKGVTSMVGQASTTQIMYSLSKNQGHTWSRPVPVHDDTNPNSVHGFFDAIVMANGEVAVAYLNDIPGKQHERDLKFVTSKGDQFGEVRTIDPFTCDCCNISLLVDNKGTLNMYYRENQDNIRDIYKMASIDNGATFSKAESLYADNWKINGCPHSGPTSSASANGNLIAWMSGTTESPGIRVVTQQGKRLFVLEDQSAKNAYLVSAPKSSVLLWEQNQASETGLSTVIAYKNITSDQNPAMQFVKNTINGTNATGVVVDNQLIVAYEVKLSNGKNSVSVTQVDL